ncbi:MAG: hypothetical protein HY898_01095 [Deltaproteobacteria bacterium]|nr:hypothetical protein [Deltaproteobacteria bacterium]
MSRSRGWGGGLACAAIVLLACASATAQSPAADNVSGVVRPEKVKGDALRSAGGVALYLPREFANLLFVTSGAAAGIVENEQVVPRVRDLLFSRDGRIGFFPTLFMETGSSFNVGGRMIASGNNEATSLRAGYGGEDANVVESRMRFARSTPVPMVLSFEGLHDRRTGLGYLGIGQEPTTDPRNRFITPLTQVSYRERRERVIGSLGMRPAPDFEVFLSSSYSQRLSEDLPPGDGPRFDDVFAPGSVPGALRTTKLVYTELALRLDTRDVRAAPVPGMVLEGYAGTSRGVQQEHGRFVRMGARISQSISIYRRTNVLIPKVVIEGTASPSGEPVPFNELTRQPDFRGFNTRRDYTSMVLSLDYRWKLASFIAARLFADAATVAPSTKELSFKGMRYVGGFGFDLYSDNAELARIGLAISEEGALFMFSFGVSPRFGDRQHRD